MIGNDGQGILQTYQVTATEPFDQAMARAGRELMNEVAQKYDRARQDAERERRQLAGMIGTVRAKRNQTFWLIALPVLVFVFTLLASPVLSSELPFGLNKWAAWWF